MVQATRRRAQRLDIADERRRLCGMRKIIMPRKSKSTPRAAKPYYGTGHDPVWAEQQLTNILQTVMD